MIVKPKPKLFTYVSFLETFLGATAAYRRLTLANVVGTQAAKFTFDGLYGWQSKLSLTFQQARGL